MIQLGMEPQQNTKLFLREPLACITYEASVARSLRTPMNDAGWQARGLSPFVEDHDNSRGPLTDAGSNSGCQRGSSALVCRLPSLVDAVYPEVRVRGLCGVPREEKLRDSIREDRGRSREVGAGNRMRDPR